MRFVSEENLLLHKNYVRDLELKYSILNKSISNLANKNIKDIYYSSFERDIKTEALGLLYEIEMHKLYFSSFSSDKSYISSEKVKSLYKNEANFLNAIYKYAFKCNHGFVFAYLKRGKIEIAEGSVERLVWSYSEPKLCLDVCEHSYYGDFGFDKKRYLLSSIPYLKLDVFDGKII